ncbi:orotidine 5'-phosphate decarboxylase [Phenylobacterium sp. Root77]|uniref:orotidine-5'-phosphate decarboxylase n=1 Tax=unclassified Phenylobacterium TaxID=2640670 RepID=UPI00070014E1|nr:MULTISPECIES: orotidine-5'-phosphate decarboxylase [unclassified Phenylobacterium]KQW69486.1 orotidine 5'-phosphate decarboxylase [Phenylobacterium sp. Root1277]KQW95997.1 orotidine 5'-phosphate decarboxylase [Phenylobacterium sp. Root1290]KRC41786.1 orotidine 5'-phosphate decarboxylase [Phenylobacterium sp. Root77]
MRADPRLIVPLDVPTVTEARALVETVGEAVSFYKVGLELFATGGGMALAQELKAQGKQVFLDWKLHDIGTTVQRSAAVLADTGCDFLTVHAEPQVLKAAVQGRGRSNLKILGVTVLTSLHDADLIEMGFNETARSLVERRIHHAIAAGADGVIASPHEAELARKLGGKDFLVVTPGVRPDWSAKNDQARAATPADALRAGASHIVCGRPITAANDPHDAALRVAAEMAGV